MDGSRLLRELPALLLLFAAVFLGVSLAGFSPQDPTFNHHPGTGSEILNPVGKIGSFTGGTFVEFLGMGAFVWPVVLVYLSLVLFRPSLKILWWRWAGLVILYLCLLVWAEFPAVKEGIAILGVEGGGFVGRMIYSWSFSVLYFWGTFLTNIFLTLAGLQLATGFSWAFLFSRAGEAVRQADLPGSAADLKKKLTPRAEKGSSSHREPEKKDQSRTSPVKPGPVRASEPRIKNNDLTGYALPPLDLLSAASNDGPLVDRERLTEMSAALKSCLEDFSVQGEVQHVQPGPVVTMFEFKPAPGIKISRIANLGDDLALALKASAVRIVAPLPGKDTIGVEIPNEHRQMVYLREILESPVFYKAKLKLPLALGKDIQGQSRVEDLARMPHLLVAGATGAGKSVCLNSLILSLIFRFTPDELKLLLIDPKRIELAVYNDLPHLVHPVVTDMHLAKNALDWAVFEMESRYDRMARMGVRNIEGFNQKLASMGQERPEGLEDLEPMPYLVLIIDEMADLMLTAAKEVEVDIVRLAQLARASGMHIILATQRPSVDVVTGIIKANFPSRIAFQVSSKHDSRTILDAVGAEYLLGHGDMLFKSSGGQLQRTHGAFVDEDEIARVVDFWKSKGNPEFDLDFAQWKKNDSSNGPDGYENDPIIDDPKYVQAVEFILDQGKGSISLIQRRFRIGYNKAALFIEQMEKDGILGPQEGSKPRQVLKKQ
ncbi:DNA translocase FtsK [Desulfonatronovibrio hydrogenovorans]|uniref:DNA translocase FtsK n=1 Tax=Desulfonatronovibrio hydrogenovorans TaxID=53245 RepID=UPI00048B4CB4|nr:DNA translocase FtsK [Desulfonatronovibrio hydrogenovorans]